ncbi:uncharacterized protein LOC142986086 [Anticarsia gemmatalis]|uniref:uncharacterized protein LOC142986086 n=1 Tax=Anticarsia gemmatalis TaxID=129554 RepID=UPI003F76019C
MFRYRYPRLIRFLHLTRQPRLLYRARPIPPPGGYGPRDPPDDKGSCSYMRPGDIQMRTFRTYKARRSHYTESDLHTGHYSDSDIGTGVDYYRTRRSQIIYDVPAETEIGRGARTRQAAAHQTIRAIQLLNDRYN